ncbi:YfiR/HmsC family protein [Microscilla marina]|nr:YfiR/HmsC family protein [Microscilla marina]
MARIFLHITKVFIFTMLLSLAGGFVLKTYAQTKNYTYQALFLHKFTEHVNWPVSAAYGKKFRIGILGDKYVYRLMNNYLSQKKIAGVNTEVIHFTNVLQIRPCHVLFISESSNLNLKIVFARLRDIHCLIVSEKQDLFTKPKLFPVLAAQSCINLKVVNNRLRFDLNKPNIRARGLSLDSDQAKPALQTLAKYDSLKKAIPKKIARTQSNILRIINRSKALDDSLNLLQQNLRRMLAQENNYLKDIKKAKTEIKSLEKEEEEKLDSIATLQTKIQALMMEINRKNNELNSEKDSINALKYQINRLSEEVREDADVKKLLLVVKSLEDELKQRGGNVEELRDKLQNIRSANKELKNADLRYTTIQERLKRVKADKLAAEEEKKRLRADKERLSAEQKAQVARHRFNIIIASLVSLLLLILLLVFILSNRRRKNMIRKLNAVNIQLTQSKGQIEQQNEALQRNIVELQKKKELEAANRKLEEANKKLDQLQKYKDKLTNMIVHDLKNPLGAVLVNSKMEATNYNINPKIKKRLQDIHQASTRIKVYIEDMLAIQTYANSELPLQLAAHQMFAGIQNAVNILRSAIREKSIVIENNIPTEYYAKYDSKYIGRVYENLLSNAIKYTDPGGKIMFSAEMLPADDQSPLGYIHFAIADSGQGIPEDKFKQIFEPFMQLEAREFANTSSTGIGLTFCKMAVESHRSKIKVVSQVGVGTTFMFDLPRTELQEKSTASGAAKQAHSIEADKEATAMVLSQEERQTLKPFVQALDKVEFYEVTTLLSILKPLDQEKNSNLVQWKTAVEESIDNFNEVEYQKLKGLVV